MAVRMNRRQQDSVREKIRATQLINRLHGHIFRKVKISVTQLRAIEILLKKTLPDLAAVEHTGADGEPIRVTFTSLDAGAL